jgi:CHAT domain-containing protein/Tfp pilus assembly protein PilF
MELALSLILSLWLCLYQKAYPAYDAGPNYQSFRQSFQEGITLHSQGEYEQAFQALARALSISREYHLAYDQRRCLIRLAVLKWDLGLISESSSYFRVAQVAFHQAGDRRSEEYCLHGLKLIQFYNQGKAVRNASLYPLSLESFDHAILLAREMGFPEFELKCLRQKGLTYWEMGRFHLFLECNKEGLELSSRIHHRVEKARCLNNIGVFYQKQNDYSLALTHFESALSIIRTTEDRATEAECLSNMGIAYRDLGNFLKAQSYLTSALDLDKKAGEAGPISMDLDNIGTLYLRRGVDNQDRQDLLQSLEYFRACLSIQGTEQGGSPIRFSALNNIGFILSELKDYSRARNYLNLALELVDKGSFVAEKCHILANIAASYFYEERIDKAMIHYRKALDIGSQHHLENTVMESCLGLGQCLEKRDEYSSALSFYKRSIEAMEAVRDRISSEFFKIGFVRNKMEAFERTLKILVKGYSAQPSQTALEEIFRYIERAKAQAFLESINDAFEEPGGAVIQKPHELEKKISKDIAILSHELISANLPEEKKQAMNVELEHLEEEYFRLISEIKRAAHEKNGTTPVKECSIAQVQRYIIDDETALIEYFLGDQESYLIYVSKTRTKMMTLGGRSKIGASLRAYLKMISSHSNDNAAGFEAGKRIAMELLPLEAALNQDSIRALIIVPDEILHYLPFETMRLSKASGSAYLIEKFVVSYCPSASSLFLLKQAQTADRPKKELLAVGGPDYESGDVQTHQSLSKGDVLGQLYYEQGLRFSPLPFSKKEVVEIGKLFKESEKDILVGQNASERAVKNLSLEEYRFIHFACHGILDRRFPFRSALALSKDTQREEDGFLQMREVYYLIMNADLVVLSACYTGAGVLERAEGPIGLARPFFYAGARSVLSSLWPINDKSTVYFMKQFYRFLVDGMSASKALQLTKIKMLHSPWPQPAHWASFVLSGNPVAGRLN